MDVTAERIGEASLRYGVPLAVIPVTFDLFGVSAGMYRSAGRQTVIRYNPLIFSRYFEENLRDTVPHEVAHYVVDKLYGRRGVRPHGCQWQAVMTDFGVTPLVRHDWNLEGLGIRRQRRFAYRCGCGRHDVTAVRHNRMRKRGVVYRCRRCGEALRPID